MSEEPINGTSPSEPVSWAIATRALAGQSESGDRGIVKTLPGGILAAVIDGLGHGIKAAEAAGTAVRALQEQDHPSVIPIMKYCHTSLLRTRGVVMSLAAFQPAEGTLTWLGVGNVEGILCRADGDGGRERLLLAGGVVGYRLPTLRAVVHAISPGDTLIFVTDGIRSSFSDDLPLKLPPQEIADHVLAKHSRGSDDALVLVARYNGPN